MGGGGSVAFHAGNVLLHVFNTFLVSKLCQMVKTESKSTESSLSLTALSFAVHPVHTEAVRTVIHTVFAWKK